MEFKSLKAKLVHFVGIGGVSMSGIAKCFVENGINVQGSDSALKDSNYIKGFESIGIKLFDSHHQDNITKNIDLIVKTSTIKDDNPEIIEAKKLGIKIIERFEALELILSAFKVKIGISGSSGKTTTTALTWQAFYGTLGVKPSCIIGTILNEVHSSVYVNNSSEFCVVEADESDGSFADMNFNVAIITDIDADHLDHKRYQGNRENLIKHFEEFIFKTLKNGGVVIYNSDCKTTHTLIQSFLPQYNGNIFSYSGIDKAVNTVPYIKGDCFLNEVKNTQNGLILSCKGIVSANDIFIPMIGKINAFNALPGLILSKILLKNEKKDIFTQFQGINKRVEVVGNIGNITIIDDYAHSPKKIKTFIQSFASYCKDINAQFVIICEPHKYTRVASLYDEYITCFDDCNYLIMMEIFGIQGRDAMMDISSERLTSDIKHRWALTKNNNFYIKSLKFNKDILNTYTFSFVKEFFNMEHKVFYVFLGAGFSSKYAHLLYGSIK